MGKGPKGQANTLFPSSPSHSRAAIRDVGLCAKRPTQSNCLGNQQQYGGELQEITASAAKSSSVFDNNVAPQQFDVIITSGSILALAELPSDCFQVQ
jgi:hypothetical protein